MTYRFRWVLGLCFAAAITGGCSSTSGTPLSSEGGASDDGGAPAQDAPAAMMCDAVSLAAPPDAGAAACFDCQAMKCMPEITTCATDCSCAPAFSCLEQNSTGDSLNSGFSVCTDAVDAISNGNAALTNLSHCATTNCNAECFGGATDGG
jgi:hypothetical protein